MSTAKIHLKTKDHLVTQESFELIYDSDYDMLCTHPKPEDNSKYYETSNYISHNDAPKNLFEVLYQKVKGYTLKRKITLINHYSTSGKSLLDIGCGTGEFLSFAKKANWNTHGVEVNEHARLKAEEKQLQIKENISELSNQKFNVITLWHVLEHLPSLKKDIRQIESLLTDDGTLVIAVPNFKSYDAQFYKEHWAAYDTPRHLWHFSQTAISKLFKEYNFQIQKTMPMYFDSYYVSLLSEKYKKGTINYPKAIYRGWLSNWKAKRSGEYSSLIYVLKKE
jgi:2-polyprenyl-3-methyl-5-hydroxy-6-metoxy-1,4-benzoquinol methylase